MPGDSAMTGDQRRMSIDDDKTQLPSNPVALAMHDPSKFNQGGQINSSALAGNHGMVQNGVVEVVCNSKKLEDAMKEAGHNIKHHEENIKYLKAHKNKLDDSILDIQVVLGGYHSASEPAPASEDKESSNEEETIGQILRHDKSAAAVWFQLKTRHGAQVNQVGLMKDIVGIVALLGKIDDDNLSRLFSHYLGLEIMLAVVCKTRDGVSALETYDKEGSINKSSGLHGLGASIGRALDDKFVVICLESIRPYDGEFIANDPQRRLAFLKPRLAKGETPCGFLGFAVNMINIDNANLYCATSTGHGLRETLFYSLFKQLQVYKTRADMMQALPFLKDGAISLDGGIIKSNGVSMLGNREVDVKFPKSSRRTLPDNYFESESRMKELKWKRTRCMDDLQREEALMTRAKWQFELTKQDFVGFLANSSSTYPKPAGERSTPMS